jgi:hypothetical protein
MEKARLEETAVDATWYTLLDILYASPAGAVAKMVVNEVETA